MTGSDLLNRARPEILAMKAYSSARSLYKSRPGMIFLDANECPFEPFIGADSLSRYPDQQPEPLVRAMSDLYDLASRNMAVTRGADEAIDLLFRVFCRPGRDNVLICPPTFAMYEQAALIQGASVYKVPLKDGFSLDTDGIFKKADENTKLVFICSPNNPTANLMDPDAVEKICLHFRDSALVILDETYIEYAPRPSLIPWIESHPNLVVLRTLSKSFAAAGIRCGLAAAREDIIRLLLKVLPPYPIPRPVVQAAVQILDERNRDAIVRKRQETLKTKEKFISGLKSVKGVERIYPSDANFILARVADAKSFEEKCLAADIIIRNQSHLPGLENCVRIAIGAADEMERLLNALTGQIPDEKDQTPQRMARLQRKTKETAISATVNLDRAGPVKIETGIGFYDHMLEQVARHGGFSLILECNGDLDIDPHHTIEDCAIVLGQALRQALGDKAGIGRYGFTVPMDEALAEVAIDLSGRAFLAFEGSFPADRIGDLPTDMIAHIFRSMAENLQATCHIRVRGDNAHHMSEACFKGMGRALRQAIRREGSDLPSTKGML